MFRERNVSTSGEEKMSVEEDAKKARQNAAGAVDQLIEFQRRVFERLDGIEWCLAELDKKLIAIQRHVGKEHVQDEVVHSVPNHR
jgi:hypothetical protein